MLSRRCVLNRLGEASPHSGLKNRISVSLHGCVLRLEELNRAVGQPSTRLHQVRLELTRLTAEKAATERTRDEVRLEQERVAGRAGGDKPLSEAGKQAEKEEDEKEEDGREGGDGKEGPQAKIEVLDQGGKIIRTLETPARLGVKYECFDCGAKFYDLNRPEPLCPKCGADQRKRPKNEPKARPPASSRRRRSRADSRMAPLLEDEEVVAAPAVEKDALDLGLVESSDTAFLGDEV